MAFTDRYIKLPIELYNRKQAELTNNNDDSAFQGYMMINPFDIYCYRPCYDVIGDNSIIDEVVVDFRNGQSCVVLLHIDDFEKQLNAFAK